MKKIGLLGIAAALGILALFVGQSWAAEVGLSDIKASAARDCGSFKTLLSKYQSDLAEGNTKYDALKTDISLWRGYTTKDFATLPAKKSGLKAKLDSLYTTVDGYCDTVETASDASAAQTAYNSLKTEKNKTKLIGLISKLNDYYAKYKELANNINYNLAFRDLNDFATRLEEAKFSRENDYLAKTNGIIFRIENKSGSLVDLTDILNIFNSPTDSAVSELSYKLQTKKSEADSLNSEFKRNAMPAMNNLLVDAAQDGAVITIANTELKADYDELANYYSAKAVKDKQGLQKKIAGEKNTLASYTTKLSKETSLNNLSDTLAAQLKAGPAKLASDANSPLIKAEAGLNAAVSYTSIAAKVLADKNAMIKEFYIKMFDLAMKFNSNYGKAKELQAVCQRFNDTTNFNLLKNGLANAEDKAKLESLKNDLTTPCSQAATLTNSATIKGIEDDLTTNNNSMAPTLDAIKGLAEKISTYGKTLSDASSKIGRARSAWWKLIETAVKGGEASFRAGFTASTLDDEQKAAQLYANFESKRDQYREKSKKLIDSRKLVLQNNQLVMNDASRVAASASGLKNSFTAKLAVLLGTGEGSLDAYYNEIVAQNNYADLKELVDGIKPTFLLSEVIIPLQKMYLNLDSHYGKYADLNTIAGLLNTRAEALPAANQTDLIKVSQNSITSLLAELDTSLATLSADMKSLLDATIDADSQSTLRASLQPQEREIKSLISKLGREERNLLNYIKQAEKTAAATPAE